MTAPFTGDGVLIAAHLHDGKPLPNPHYSNSTFANVSFLRSKVTKGSFRNCVFIECYFREAELRGTAFVGCKFIGCNFTHITIRDCDFRYAEFRQAAPPFSELEHSAPQQPNLRYELFDSLSRVAQASGNAEMARRYRLAAIDALGKHLRAGMRAESDWYRQHFDGWGRVGAAVRLSWNSINRLLWGHGESAWRLLASAVVVSVLLFPILFLIFQNGVAVSTGNVTASDYLWVSVSNFLLLDRLSDVSLTSWTTQLLSAIEGLSGVVFAGMYVTLLVKALLRR